MVLSKPAGYQSSLRSILCAGAGSGSRSEGGDGWCAVLVCHVAARANLWRTQLRRASRGRPLWRWRGAKKSAASGLVLSCLVFYIARLAPGRIARLWPMELLQLPPLLISLSSFPPRQRRVRSVLSPRCVRAAARRAVLSPSLYLSGTACFL